VEASTLHARPSLGRVSLSISLLRLRSDEQLVALFRAGHDDAFGVIHDRYRQRLFAYVRQMLSGASRQDAEDVLQDVYVRAFGALRADRRDVNLRAWLYRVAHNRCIDYLRRPAPPDREIFEVSRKPLHDPIEEAQRRDDLKRLVADVGRLPEQQRSALLMRELDGMSYADLAAALDVTVPAVKSLLVRARVGLVEAAEARDTDCDVIRGELLEAYDRGVKASGRARRHMRECGGCREYRTALRGMQRSFAALSPVAAAGPLALAAKVLGLGGAGGGAAAGGGAVAGSGGALAGGAAAAGGGVASATACKVAAVVCGAALAGGAVEVNKLTHDQRPARTQEKAAVAPAAPPPAAPAVQAHPVAKPLAAPGPAPAHDAAERARERRHESVRARARTKREGKTVAKTPAAVTEPASGDPAAAPGPADAAPVAGAPTREPDTGGAAAPPESSWIPSDPSGTADPVPATPSPQVPEDVGAGAQAQQAPAVPDDAVPPAGSATGGGTGGTAAP
jgi:RNA polymerase sigma factor (sigma-70 family)